MSKTPRPRERDVQRACIAWLKLKGVLVVRVNSAAFAVGTGSGRRFIRANSEPGCSDALVCLPGGAFAAIEFKRPGGKLTPAQRSFLDAVTKAGGLALCVDSLDGLVAALAAEGYEL